LPQLAQILHLKICSTTTQSLLKSCCWGGSRKYYSCLIITRLYLAENADGAYNSDALSHGNDAGGNDDNNEVDDGEDAGNNDNTDSEGNESYGEGGNNREGSSDGDDDEDGNGDGDDDGKGGYSDSSDGEGNNNGEWGDGRCNVYSHGIDGNNNNGSGNGEGNSSDYGEGHRGGLRDGSRNWLESESGPMDGTLVDAHAELARQRSEWGSTVDAVELMFNLVRNIPRSLEDVAAHFNYPELPELTRQFLYDQLHPDSPYTSRDIPLSRCPNIYERVDVFSSAIAIYWAPSDPSGVGGMRQERIRSTTSWGKGPPRYDCMFLSKDPSIAGLRGLHVVRAMLLFSFTYNDILYPCALVEWLLPVGEEPDPTSRMWVVEPELDEHGARIMSVVHMGSVLRAAHLIPCYGEEFLPAKFRFTDSLDAFRAYFVNNFIDHSAHAMIY
jgi:hypothetical protein